MEGCTQNLYFAEIDDSMKVTEGGGNWKEGEVIENVFLTLGEVRELLLQDEVPTASGMLYALTWFLGRHNKPAAASTAS